MPTAFYLCPYDTIPRAGQLPYRRCAMSRYVPTRPHLTGAFWDEAETLGNATLVKLSASPALHTTVRADADFLLLPFVAGQVPLANRPALIAYLVLLGYTATALNNTSWRRAALFDLLTDQVHHVEHDGLGGIRLLPARRPGSRHATDLDRHLPDED